MKASCLINSHNYVDYVADAVDSALSQVEPFAEIIVVDDGSTDGSVELLHDRYRGTPRVRIIDKPQAGQLSCFHRGVNEATGDVCFFLDADDRFRDDMLQKALAVYRQHPHVDCLATGFEEFGNRRGSPRRQPTRDRGQSVLAAVYYRHWVGNPTSCLSMRLQTARRILPYPFEDDWVTRADDVLIFGASIVGAHKYHLDESLVGYRIHGGNQHADRQFNASQKWDHTLRVNRLINWYVTACGYDMVALSYRMSREFETWSEPTLREMVTYAKMASRARLPWHLRIEQAAVVASHYLREMLATRRRRRQQPTESLNDSSSSHPALADRSNPRDSMNFDPQPAATKAA